MKPTLIIQSVAPRPPEWIRLCMHSVEAWASQSGHVYEIISDHFFMGLSSEFSNYSNVTRSDLSRLRVIAAHLEGGLYGEVIWIDSDFLIWDRNRFELPPCEPGAC